MIEDWFAAAMVCYAVGVVAATLTLLARDDAPAPRRRPLARLGLAMGWPALAAALVPLAWRAISRAIRPCPTHEVDRVEAAAAEVRAAGADLLALVESYAPDGAAREASIAQVRDAIALASKTILRTVTASPESFHCTCGRCTTERALR